MHKAVLSESSEETFIEVVIRTGQRNVEYDMSKHISFQAIPALSGSFELRDGSKRTNCVVSSPFRLGLSIKYLPDRDNSERMRYYCSDSTGNTTDPCFLSVGEVVVGFYWFEGVVESCVDCVSDEKISQSAVEMGIETLVYACQTVTCFVDLTHDFERVVALLLTYRLKREVPLRPRKPMAVAWN